MDPAIFFEDVFTERAARLRDQVDQLRDELARAGDAEPDEPRARSKHDQG